MHNYCLSNTEHRTKVFMLVADDNVRDHAHTGGGRKLNGEPTQGGVYINKEKKRLKY